MIVFSRRQLASYGVDLLATGETPAVIARRLAAGLAVSGKQKETELLIADIARELEDRGLLAQAEITSARKLQTSVLRELQKQIKKAAKVSEVSIIENLDDSVIGGVRIETASHTWDKTAARRLAEIKGGI